MPAVELIYDSDCPNVSAARRVLLQAFGQLGSSARWREWSRSDPQAPARVRGFGSPTILVDGQDVMPLSDPADGQGCCRLYRGDDKGLTVVPPVAAVRERLRSIGRGSGLAQPSA